ncbi:hypothetical protein DN407_29300 (plasmid) [Bacillus sp. JAS24-2]|nr:hypothetical protein DN407_29300 [Bacillus sp. JAS24-2]
MRSKYLRVNECKLIIKSLHWRIRKRTWLLGFFSYFDNICILLWFIYFIIDLLKFKVYKDD